MKKILFPIIALILIACSAQVTPPLPLLGEGTGVRETPPPTQTPIPTPTLHPDFVALQKLIADSSNLVLLPDGTIENNGVVIPNLNVDQNGVINIIFNNERVVIETSQISFDDEGLTIDGYELNENGEWVEAYQIFTLDQIATLTPDQKLANSPELDGHKKWRASGQYVIYLDNSGEVVQAYDMTTGEFRDIPDYPLTNVENMFSEGQIDPADLFNGNYFLWLEKQANTLACSPDMRTDVPMIYDPADWNLIQPNPKTAPNFTRPGSAFFIRDHALHTTEITLEDGSVVPYAVMPLFMCDLNDPDIVYPIATVFSGYYPKDQEWFNERFGKITLPQTWKQQMNTTPIIAGSISTVPGRDLTLIDPLVGQTFEKFTDMPERITRFVDGDFSALSEPGLVLLNFIGTQPSKPDRFK